MEKNIMLDKVKVFLQREKWFGYVLQSFISLLTVKFSSLPFGWLFYYLSSTPGDGGLEVLAAVFSTGAREPREMCWGTNELLAGGQ